MSYKLNTGKENLLLKFYINQQMYLLDGYKYQRVFIPCRK